MDNILQLHEDLKNQIYIHDKYQSFYINDPKPRHIHKATVRDRVLHHAIYRVLYPFFAKIFIADSFSCQLGKGTHKAINRFRDFAYEVSKNNTKICWILKCDIRKFFDNIDHRILKDILGRYIGDKGVLWLLEQIIGSFHKNHQDEIASRSLAMTDKIGLPLGNLTSQLFVNIYMNEFDQFMKHIIKAKYYIRYADDFVIFSEDEDWLKLILLQMAEFLKNKLSLEIHPNKVFLKTLASGVDFLGWVHFPDHRVLRTATKRRMFKRLEIASSLSATPRNDSVKQSYLGLLGWGNSYKIMKILWEN